MSFQLHLAWKNMAGDHYKESFDLDSVGSHRGLSFSLEDSKKESKNRRLLSLKLKLSEAIELDQCFLSTKLSIDKRSQMMVNGYQSWSHSREYDFHGKQSDISKLIRPFGSANGDYDFVSYSNFRGQFHSWTYTYFRGKDLKSFLFLGSVNESFAFTIFHFDYDSSKLRIKKDLNHTLLKEGEYLLFDILIQDDAPSVVWDDYGSFFQNQNLKMGKKVGWLSWYYYYQNINEQIILENLEQVSRCNLPFDVFEIDDGYQRQVGDWTEVDKKKFPNGLAPIAQKIKEEGLIPGLWLAPLVCSKQSNIFKNHQDWLLRDNKGKLVKAGYNPIWSSWIYVLDFYSAGVQAYLKEIFQKVLGEWGFDLVKLDFLYAACWKTSRDKTRGQVMNDVMSFLRDLVADKFLLACGVPLGAAFGKADLCRIGSDVTEYWEHKTLNKLSVAERLSTYNSLTSTLNRWQLGEKMFANDPDIFMLRDDHCELNWQQKKTLLTVNYLLGQTMFTSDNFAHYEDKHWNLLKEIFPILSPVVEKVVSGQQDFYVIHFSCRNKSYSCYVNLGAESKRVWIEHGHTQSHGLLRKSRLVLAAYSSEVVLVSDNSDCDLKLLAANDHMISGSCVQISGSQSSFEVKDSSLKSGITLQLEYLGPFEKITINGKNYTVNNFSERSQLLLEF